MKYPQLYQQFNQWTPIPAEEWLAFESKAVEKRLGKGDFLMQAGDTNLEFGIVLKGLFRLYYADPSGKEHIKAFRRDGELVGAYAEMLLKIPSRTFIQALEPSSALMISKTDFAPFYDRHNCWLKIGRIVAEKHFLAKEQREFEFLQLDVFGRYQKFCEENRALLGKVPQHQIASYLGVTPVALSRVLSRVRKQN
jgi:CRP-like cAMP-binding protein